LFVFHHLPWYLLLPESLEKQTKITFSIEISWATFDILVSDEFLYQNVKGSPWHFTYLGKFWLMLPLTSRLIIFVTYEMWSWERIDGARQSATLFCVLKKKGMYQNLWSAPEQAVRV
jgi:hypothetical protein